MSLFHRWFFKHFASKNQLPGWFKWSIGLKWVNVCLECLSLKTWTVWKPAKCFALQIIWLISVQYEFLLKGVSEQSIVILLMFQKVFHALISSDMNVNLRFFFLLKSHVPNVTSGTLRKKVSLNNSWGLKLFAFFSEYIEDLFTKKLCLRLPFPHRNLNWKSTVSKSSFFSRHVRSSIKLFLNLQLFATNHNLY